MNDYLDMFPGVSFFVRVRPEVHGLGQTLERHVPLNDRQIIQIFRIDISQQSGKFRPHSALHVQSLERELRSKKTPYFYYIFFRKKI